MAKSTPEGKVKKAVTKILDELGAYYFFPATGGYGRSGIPDIVACYEGYFIGIECKAGDNTPTKLQNREIRNIDKAGGFALVVNEGNIDHLQSTLSMVPIFAVALDDLKNIISKSMQMRAIEENRRE